VVLDTRKKVIDKFQRPEHIVPMSDNFDMDNEANGEKLLRVKEAAAKLAVSPRTVWRMIAAKSLKVVRIRGCTRVLLAEVAKYMSGGNPVGCL
jgi:excisionase family DNA binding protein